ncbi:hypothetical protein PN462_00350 [Spirulina sp. CS-785/01]|uniref:hypothetical protein n=1 Tax=Spirulina sp. CS-785/01 TaxID=3021716 RepID=UPI002330FD5D|nr:hypothetical protein [Spirulina sp. CS-785/01]MDB9311532.1 hypothetical protein [Spirulina sp. CS-785/01]
MPSTLDWSEEKAQLINANSIPSEDIEIYLSAKYGEADCFVSGNRALIQAIAAFQCFTPEAFIQTYLPQTQ